MAEGVTTDRNDPRLRQADAAEPAQQAAYLVLSDEERQRGFIRPVRRSYRHITCGTVTTMGTAIAETYARQPRLLQRHLLRRLPPAPAARPVRLAPGRRAGRLLMRPLSGKERQLRNHDREHRGFVKDPHRERAVFARLARRARRVALLRRLRREGE
jgi:hypothetical protein